MGTQLVSELVAHPAYGRVITLNRRHVPALDALATSTSVEQVRFTVDAVRVGTRTHLLTWRVHTRAARLWLTTPTSAQSRLELWRR